MVFECFVCMTLRLSAGSDQSWQFCCILIYLRKVKTYDSIYFILTVVSIASADLSHTTQHTTLTTSLACSQPWTNKLSLAHATGQLQIVFFFFFYKQLELQNFIYVRQDYVIARR